MWCSLSSCLQLWLPLVRILNISDASFFPFLQMLFVGEHKLLEKFTPWVLLKLNQECFSLVLTLEITFKLKFLDLFTAKIPSLFPTMNFGNLLRWLCFTKKKRTTISLGRVHVQLNLLALVIGASFVRLKLPSRANKNVQSNAEVLKSLASL